MKEETEQPKRLNWNYVTLAILVAGFAVSAVRVLTLDTAFESTEAVDFSNKRIVRLLHWQLEPGYRESMDAIIQEYNALPHVQQANVEIRQMTIPERVYKQFTNVHLISGTAPDLFVDSGGSASTAQMFLEPLGSHLSQPNPYNTLENLPDSISADERNRLLSMPWRNTFIGELAPNYIQSLKDYYAIPVSSVGATRIFCNRRIVAEAKALLLAGFSATPRPAWIEDCIYRVSDLDGSQSGYVTPDAALLAWLASDEPVQTLGQFFIVCQAAWQMAEQQDIRGLVPFSGSNYSISFLQNKYLEMITYPIGLRLDYNVNSGASFEEVFIGWLQGDWSFYDERMLAYFDFIREFSKQNPAGFKGLDRDQGIRRFILGKAAFMSSGGWDAASVFSQTQNFEDPSMRFDVDIIDFPLAAAGERWHSVANTRVKDGDVAWATPFSVNRTSVNKEWAIDFLQFITSYGRNERFCRDAGWLPTVKGAKVVPHMEPFIPNTRGTSGSISANWRWGMGSSIWDTYSGNIWLWGSGELDYDTFVGRVEDAMTAERTGVRRYIYNADVRSQDAYRSAERARSIQQLRAFQSDAGDRIRTVYDDMVLKSLRNYSGNEYRILWMRQTDDEPFPQF